MLHPPQKPLDRDAWLRKALDVLFLSGIVQIKVEVLARKLNLTKGSFYWHFKDRDDLLRAMVDWWRDQQLTFIARLAEQQIADPTGQIKAVINFTQHTEDSHHEQHHGDVLLVSGSVGYAVRAGAWGEISGCLSGGPIWMRCSYPVG